MFIAPICGTAAQGDPAADPVELGLTTLYAYPDYEQYRGGDHAAHRVPDLACDHREPPPAPSNPVLLRLACHRCGEATCSVRARRAIWREMPALEAAINESEAR